MKLSMATLSVLLSAAAVNGLPAAPEPAVADIISHVSGVAGDIALARVPDDWEEKKKALAKLEESRKITTERLLVAQGTQAKADLQVQTATHKLDDAEENFRDVNKELEQLEEQVKVLEARVQETEDERLFVRGARIEAVIECNAAKKQRDTAVDEVDQLRKAIAQIDEAVEHIGAPDED